MAQLSETIDVNGRRVLDVSGLPPEATGPREPVWWGNTLLMCIETTTIVLLLVTYFYIRRNFNEWPPPQPKTIPAMYHPVPDLPLPTAELILIIASLFVMHWTDNAALREEAAKVKAGLSIMFLAAAGLIILRLLGMNAHHLKFYWDQNAYASTIWVILGTHLTYLLAGLAEFFIMLLWILRHGLDPKHGLDVELAGIYWYWTAAAWLACYLVVFIGARVL